MYCVVSVICVCTLSCETNAVRIRLIRMQYVLQSRMHTVAVFALERARV